MTLLPQAKMWNSPWSVCGLHCFQWHQGDPSTQGDQQLTNVVQCLWANTKQIIWYTKTPRTAQKYWDKHDDLTSHDDLLVKGSTVIIPPALRQSSLHDHHEEHAGNTRCQLTGRNLIYWPGIDNDIKDYIKQYPTCIRLSPTLLAQPWSTWCFQVPWQKLSANFVDWYGKKFLLNAEYIPNIPFFSQDLLHH